MHVALVIDPTHSLKRKNSFIDNLPENNPKHWRHSFSKHYASFVNCILSSAKKRETWTFDSLRWTDVLFSFFFFLLFRIKLNPSVFVWSRFSVFRLFVDLIKDNEGGKNGEMKRKWGKVERKGVKMGKEWKRDGGKNERVKGRKQKWKEQGRKEGRKNRDEEDWRGIIKYLYLVLCDGMVPLEIT